MADKDLIQELENRIEIAKSWKRTWGKSEFARYLDGKIDAYAAILSIVRDDKYNI